MKSGAIKTKKQDQQHNGEFLRRPAKLQPPGREKYKLKPHARWKEEDEEEEDIDLFSYDEEDEEEEDKD
jgi:hypothetical protein